MNEDKDEGIVTLYGNEIDGVMKIRDIVFDHNITKIIFGRGEANKKVFKLVDEGAE